MSTEVDTLTHTFGMATQQQVVNDIKSSLNEEQCKAFEECINGVGSVLCTGQGGTGKSWLLECVVRYFREFPLSDSKLVAVTASTGVAAFLIKGMTLHRFAGTGIEETNLSMMIAKASRGQSRLYWRDTGILIVDEVSMVSATFFENLSLLAKSIRGSQLPFGGIRLIMFGDFLQLPPVSKVDHSTVRIFHTDAWQEMCPKVIELKSIVRQTDAQFIKVLSEIRYGICSDETEAYIRSLDRDLPHEDGVDPIRLFAKKDPTNSYNASMLQSLDNPNDPQTKSMIYKSIDTGDKTLLRLCPAPQTLELKKGAQVMVTRNIAAGVVNGSIGTIMDFDSTTSAFLRKPRVRLMMPDGNFSEILVNRVSWETIAPDGKVMASRVQFPLILAWAVTMHKSQGQTLPKAFVDMSGVFETGQAYVALSRCSDPSRLRVSNFRKSHVMAAQSCVRFYHDLSAESDTSDLPSYTQDTRPSIPEDNPPNYLESGATEVASATEQPWDSTVAVPPLLHEQALDTQIMLGNLSLQENSNYSQSDLES